MTDGGVAEWHVKEGDPVSAGDAIADITTDKSTVSFDVQDDGFLAKILVPAPSDTVPVGTAIGVIVEEEEDIAAFANYTAEAHGTAAAPAAPAAEATPAAPAAPATPAPAAPAAPAAAAPAAPAAAAAAPVAAGGRVFASPFARKLAREAGVDIAAVAAFAASGPNGRVIASDVQAFLEQAPAAAATAAAGAAPVAAGAGGDIPHTAMRRVIAERLTASKQEVPHYHLSTDVQLDALLALRAQLNADVDTPLSLNDFIVKAAALALRKVPAVNSSWLANAVREYDYVDVAVTVNTVDGIVAPVVRDADTSGLASISSAVQDLATKAQERALNAADYTGATFTVSNLGAYGIKSFAPIITQPQAAVLAVGTAEKRVLPNTDPEAEVPYRQATMMSVTLGCDHRVVDGAVGAQWLAAFRGYIESPTTMML